MILIYYLASEYEMFSCTVFLCCIVTVMLFLFLGYHTYLICKGLTTNEGVKRVTLVPFIENKFAFMSKWEKARTEKKSFKPA